MINFVTGSETSMTSLFLLAAGIGCSTSEHKQQTKFHGGSNPCKKFNILLLVLNGLGSH